MEISSPSIPPQLHLQIQNQISSQQSQFSRATHLNQTTLLQPQYSPAVIPSQLPNLSGGLSHSTAGNSKVQNMQIDTSNQSQSVGGPVALSGPMSPQVGPSNLPRLSPSHNIQIQFPSQQTGTWGDSMSDVDTRPLKQMSFRDLNNTSTTSRPLEGPFAHLYNPQLPGELSPQLVDPGQMSPQMAYPEKNYLLNRLLDNQTMFQGKNFDATGDNEYWLNSFMAPLAKDHASQRRTLQANLSQTSLEELITKPPQPVYYGGLKINNREDIEKRPVPKVIEQYSRRRDLYRKRPEKIENGVDNDKFGKDNNSQIRFLLKHQHDVTRGGRKRGMTNTSFISSFKNHLKLKLPDIQRSGVGRSVNHTTLANEAPQVRFNNKSLKSHSKQYLDSLRLQFVSNHSLLESFDWESLSNSNDPLGVFLPKAQKHDFLDYKKFSNSVLNGIQTSSDSTTNRFSKDILEQIKEKKVEYYGLPKSIQEKYYKNLLGQNTLQPEETSYFEIDLFKQGTDFMNSADKRSSQEGGPRPDGAIQLSPSGSPNDPTMGLNSSAKQTIAKESVGYNQIYNPQLRESFKTHISVKSREVDSKINQILSMNLSPPVPGVQFEIHQQTKGSKRKNALNKLDPQQQILLSNPSTIKPSTLAPKSNPADLGRIGESRAALAQQFENVTTEVLPRTEGENKSPHGANASVVQIGRQSRISPDSNLSNSRKGASPTNESHGQQNVVTFSNQNIQAASSKQLEKKISLTQIETEFQAKQQQLNPLVSQLGIQQASLAPLPPLASTLQLDQVVIPRKSEHFSLSKIPSSNLAQRFSWNQQQQQLTLDPPQPYIYDQTPYQQQPQQLQQVISVRNSFGQGQWSENPSPNYFSPNNRLQARFDNQFAMPFQAPMLANRKDGSKVKLGRSALKAVEGAISKHKSYLKKTEELRKTLLVKQPSTATDGGNESKKSKARSTIKDRSRASQFKTETVQSQKKKVEDSRPSIEVPRSSAPSQAPSQSEKVLEEQLSALLMNSWKVDKSTTNENTPLRLVKGGGMSYFSQERVITNEV